MCLTNDSLASMGPPKTWTKIFEPHSTIGFPCWRRWKMVENCYLLQLLPPFNPHICSSIVFSFLQARDGFILKMLTSFIDIPLYNFTSKLQHVLQNLCLFNMLLKKLWCYQRIPSLNYWIDKIFYMLQFTIVTPQHFNPSELNCSIIFTFATRFIIIFYIYSLSSCMFNIV
jgi:hypothetical protein